jgi:hypothetical protein
MPTPMAFRFLTMESFMLWKPDLTFFSPASAEEPSAVILISTSLAIALWLSLLDYSQHPENRRILL